MRPMIPWQDATGPNAVAKLAIDPAHTALLVVDMQQYAGAHTERPRRVLAPNLRLRDFFRARGLPVIWLRVGAFLPDGRDMHPERLARSKSPTGDTPYLASRGTPNFELRPELEPLPTELVVDKNSSGAFNSCELDLYLRNLGVENLMLCGVASNACVDNTARGAADHGYNVILVDDACCDGDDFLHQTTLDAFARHFGAVYRTDAVLALFARLLAREPATV
ncbi:MAG TPA: isochorismatase family cysteine hydrolase [Chloroflexota bacterium]|jgi:nicotinamidase-related amidase